MSAIIGNVLMSGIGVGFLLTLIARLIPNEKLDKMGYNFGVAVSKFGVGKLGKASWEKLEDFFENSLGILIEGVKKGLDSDDAAQ